MTRVLILYGTTDGHTLAIAQAIGDTLSKSGIDADIIQAGTLDPAIHDYAGLIVAASVHAGRYQKEVERWVRAHAGEFGSRPTAFVSVCLSILEKSNPKATADRAALVARFAGTTGWTPGVVKQIAGALFYTRYGIFKRWMMKRIVATAGGDTDTSRDYIYTDWAEVRSFAEDFRRRLATAA